MKTGIASKNIIAATAVIVLLLALAACASPAPAVTSAPQPTTAPAATLAPQPTTAPVVAASPVATVTGVLRYGLEDDPQNWTPYKVVDCQNMTVMSQIWSSLLRYDSQGQLAGDLAESWEWQDDKTVIFHLRKNVKWHNGDAFTADQVVLSMNRRMDPKWSISAASLNELIAKWEAPDPLTVKLTLKQPSVTILRMLTTAPGQAFILHPNFDEATAGRSRDTTVGTGPFMFQSYEPGVSVKLVRNPNYYLPGKPAYAGIEFRPIHDDQSRMTALRAGDVDMVEYLDFPMLATLRKDPNIYIPKGEGFYGSRLEIDATVPPTDDPKVRQALNYAIDRDTVVKTVLAGEGSPVWGGAIPKGRLGYAPDLDNYFSFDPKKAKALLAEAGWVDSKGDGLLYKDGKPLKIVMVTWGPSFWSQVGEVFQQNLKSIGVQMDLQALNWDEYKAKRQANKDAKTGTYNILGSTLWGLDFGDEANFYTTNGQYNFNHYSNPQLDQLYLQANATRDDAKRGMLIQQMQALVLKDAPYVSVAWISRSEGVRKNVENFVHLNEEGCYGINMWEAALAK